MGMGEIESFATNCLVWVAAIVITVVVMGVLALVVVGMMN